MCKGLIPRSPASQVNLDGSNLPIPALRGETVPGHYLDLSSQGLGLASACVVARLLRINTSLTELLLKDNKLGTRGVEVLAEAFVQNEKIEQVAASPCPDCRSARQCFELPIAASLQVTLDDDPLPVKKLKGSAQLDFHDHKFGPHSAIVIASLIGSNPLLSQLILPSLDLLIDPTWVRSVAVQGTQAVGATVAHEDRRVTISDIDHNNGRLNVVDLTGITKLAESFCVCPNLEKVRLPSIASTNEGSYPPPGCCHAYSTGDCESNSCTRRTFGRDRPIGPGPSNQRVTREDHV